MAMADSFSVANARPLAIFAGYMVTAFVLAVICIKSAVTPTGRPGIKTTAQSSQTGRFRLIAISWFSLLAVFSLAWTWYYMFAYFAWSYDDWKTSRLMAGIPLVGDGNIGDWLRDTKLFKQAWASTLSSPDRAWWSLQIFGFCANWSITMGIQSNKRLVKNAWAFLLLGQIVAISFAMNLSFVARIRGTAQQDVQKPARKTRSATNKAAAEEAARPLVSVNHLLLLLTAGIALLTVVQYDRPAFMWLLLLPHVLAFAPLLLGKILPAYQVNAEVAWVFKTSVHMIIVAFATAKVFQAGQNWETIVQTLHQHPAVSSVGWDVVFCWISSISWYIYEKCTL